MCRFIVTTINNNKTRQELYFLLIKIYLNKKGRLHLAVLFFIIFMVSFFTYDGLWIKVFIFLFYKRFFKTLLSIDTLYLFHIWYSFIVFKYKENCKYLLDY